MDVLFILALYHQSVVTCILEIGDTGTVSPLECITFQFLHNELQILVIDTRHSLLLTIHFFLSV